MHEWLVFLQQLHAALPDEALGIITGLGTAGIMSVMDRLRQKKKADAAFLTETFRNATLEERDKIGGVLKSVIEMRIDLGEIKSRLGGLDDAAPDLVENCDLRFVAPGSLLQQIVGLRHPHLQEAAARPLASIPHSPVWPASFSASCNESQGPAKEAPAALNLQYDIANRIRWAARKRAGAGTRPYMTRHCSGKRLADSGSPMDSCRGGSPCPPSGFVGTPSCRAR